MEFERSCMIIRIMWGLLLFWSLGIKLELIKLKRVKWNKGELRIGVKKKKKGEVRKKQFYVRTSVLGEKNQEQGRRAKRTRLL